MAETDQSLYEKAVADLISLYGDNLKNLDFDPEEAMCILYGGQKTYKMAKQISSVLFYDPVIKNKHFRTDMERREVAGYGITKLARLIELGKQGKVPKLDWLNYGIYTYPMGGLIASSAHHGMFESFIRNLGTPEQVKKYLDDTLDYKIWGCYSQTEMGHGSDVRGLQTTATYDPKED